MKIHSTHLTPDEAPAGMSWAMLVPLIADFWLIVCTHLDTRSRAGRLKQWLNFLRRRFPEAEKAYQTLKTINDPVLVDEWLAGEVRTHRDFASHSSVPFLKSHSHLFTTRSIASS